MSEYDFLFDDEAGQFYDDGSPPVEHIYELDIPNVLEDVQLNFDFDPENRIHLTVGGRGGTHKTDTGVINALLWYLGYIHSHPENRGNICKGSFTLHGNTGEQQEHKSESESS